MDDSIYDYYELIQERYYVAFRIPGKGRTTIKFIWEPLAKKVVIAGFEEFDMFVNGEKKSFTLYEGISGSAIIRQESMPSRILRRCGQKLFIDCLPAEIRKRGGRAWLNKAIINFIFNNDQVISPRYLKKQ